MSSLWKVVVFCVLFVTAVSVGEAAAYRRGDSGEEVTQIQQRLVALGYDVTVDGAYGPNTEKAVRLFQAAKGLEADGLVGVGTYRAMFDRDMPEVSRGNGAQARRIMNISVQYIGVPYVFGGTSPYGFDCSGYVQYVFANAGSWLPRTADAQFEVGRAVNYSSLQHGDLVFFSTYAPGASHVGIYVGDGRFIHASSSRGVVIDSLGSSYWSGTYIGARRVI